MYWSHHNTNWLVLNILSASVHSLYMGQQGNLYATVAFFILMYTPIGWNNEAYITSTAEGYSHSPPAPRFAVIPVIRCAVRWWNLSRTLSISPINTQILIPYKSTDCSATL